MGEKQIEYRLHSELSDREIYLIGLIVVEWSAIENEVFKQTLTTFDEVNCQPADLPSAMNNLQFTKLLDLWKKRVIDTARGERSEVLQRQFKDIFELKPIRDAIVHGTWEWSPSNLAEISAIRVRKEKVLTARLTVDDLKNIYARLASAHFKIRFPGGLEDMAAELAGCKGYISREFLSMMHDKKESDI